MKEIETVNMNRRIKEFDEDCERLALERKKREERVLKIIESDNPHIIRSHLYLYESGPLDHWEGWKNVCTYQKEVYDQEMKWGQSYGDETAWEKLLKMERQLIIGLTSFSSYFKNDFRGDPLKYCFVEGPDDNSFDKESMFLVIAYKCDSNGTCYAFSHSPSLSCLIPNEYGQDWELYDVNEA